MSVHSTKQFASFTEIKVRGYHLDVYGHVNNARYLEFLEEARWKWVEDIVGAGQAFSREMGFSIVNININYRRPATLGEELEIGTGIKEFKSRSAVVEQVIRLKGTDMVVVEAAVTFVMVSTKTGKALPMDDNLRRFFGG